MKLVSATIFLWTLSFTSGFAPLKKPYPVSTSSPLHLSKEFDYLLHEGGHGEKVTSTRSRRVMTGGSREKAQYISSVVVDTENEIDLNDEFGISLEDDEAIIGQAESEEFDGDTKLVTFRESQGTNKFTKWISQADFQEIVWTLFVPSILALAGLKWGLGKVNANLSMKAESQLESFANEMIFHDGDLQEMSLCKLDWDGRLTWLGPSKKKRMLTVYLEDYAKRKPVSPQAIR
jgi:hypothetical protein